MSHSLAASSTDGVARTALITGASGGIGLQLAHLCAQNGNDLFLVARNRQRLAQVCADLRQHFGVNADFLALDLAEPDSPRDLFAETRDRGIRVDMLINNAGFATRGEFAHADERATLEMLQLNIVSLTHLTRLVLPGMLQRGWGRIMNVASIAAYMPGPLMAAYFASKAYVLSFTEALAQEISGTGVAATALCPGPTDTEFPRRAGLLGTKAFKRGAMDAGVVARAGYDAMMRGKAVEIPGVKNKLQLFPTPLVPRSVLAFFAKQYNANGEDKCEKKRDYSASGSAGQPQAKPSVPVHSGS